MKKIAGILTIIFTFFMCNSVVYGETDEETENVYFKRGNEITATYNGTDLSYYRHKGKDYYEDPLMRYTYYLYEIIGGTNNGKTAYCVEARSYTVAEENKVTFTKETYSGDSKVSKGFLYIINKVNNLPNEVEEKNTIRSLTLRMFYANKVRKFKVFSGSTESNLSKTYKKYPFNVNNDNYCGVIEINGINFNGNEIDCTIVKTAYNWAESQHSCTKNAKNSKDKYVEPSISSCFYENNVNINSNIKDLLNIVKNIYTGAIEEYNKESKEYTFQYDETKTNSASDRDIYAYIKSNYTNKICLNNNMKTDCITEKTGNYYKIPWKKATVIANNQRIFNIYFSSTITLYTSDIYQDMLVINPDGYSVKTTKLPPPVSCKIEKSCSNLDNTCGTTDNKIE